MIDDIPIMKQTGPTSRQFQAITRFHRTQRVMRPLVPVYRLIIALRNVAYDRAFCIPLRLDCPVISIGNMTTGGTGKTPLLIHIAGYFSQRGRQVVVLTRGYGRRNRADVIISASEVETIDQNMLDTCGDEPLLISRNTPGVRVGIGSDRFRVGHGICQHQHGHVVLLDDGFQHRQLHRTCDILVIDASQPLDKALLLPAGNLREPLKNMGRADFIVINRRHFDPASPRMKDVEQCLDRHAPRTPRFQLDFVPETLVNVTTNEKCAIDTFLNKPLLAISGIGNPRAFEQTLSMCRLTISRHLVYPDHHQFSVSDAKTMCDHIRKSNAEAVVTTEKDSLRLHPLKKYLDAPVPFFFLKIVPVFDDETAFFVSLRSKAALS